jgi:hypothetical protein
VDVNDLGILATAWQQQLAPPAAPFMSTSRKLASVKRVAAAVL